MCSVAMVAEIGRHDVGSAFSPGASQGFRRLRRGGTNDSRELPATTLSVNAIHTNDCKVGEEQKSAVVKIAAPAVARGLRRLRKTISEEPDEVERRLRKTISEEPDEVEVPKVAEVPKGPEFPKVPEPALYDGALCLARVWAGGDGAQCTRAVGLDTAFCEQHRRQAESTKGLKYGRIDGPVPEVFFKKLLKNFEANLQQGVFAEAPPARPAATGQHKAVAGTAPRKVKTNGGVSAPRRPRRKAPEPEDVDSDFEGSQSSSSSDNGQAKVASVKRRRRGSGSIALQSGTCCFSCHAEETCVAVLASLQQYEIFRAAAACRALRSAASTPRLYHCLDLRAVGRGVTTARGRARSLSHEATILAMGDLLSQTRFAQVVELNLEGLYLGEEQPENNAVLRLAALRCPQVRSLQLGEVKPGHLWSDLRRYLPPAFAQSVRTWWLARPFIINGYGRRYEIQ